MNKIKIYLNRALWAMPVFIHILIRVLTRYKLIKVQDSETGALLCFTWKRIEKAQK